MFENDLKLNWDRVYIAVALSGILLKIMPVIPRKLGKKMYTPSPSFVCFLKLSLTALRLSNAAYSSLLQVKT